MKGDLNGYTVFITGGSSGIGYEMSKQLLSEGATVIIGAKSEKKLAAAFGMLAIVGNAYAIQLDITSEESVKNAVDYVTTNFDHLDMVINNAAIGRNAPGMEKLPEGSHFYDIPTSSAKAVIDTDFYGTFLIAKYFTKIFQKQGYGSFVHVSTSSTTMTKAGSCPYGPSKAGAEALTHVMIDELKDTNIKVNIICPGGFVDTTMAGAGVVEKRRTQGKLVLEPSILNKTISFLASKEGNKITGEKIIGKNIDEWLKERNTDFKFE